MRDLRQYVPVVFCGIFLIGSLALATACAGDRQDRPPAVAGQFYPEDPTTLRTLVDEFLRRAAPTAPHHDPLALIVPHAGYVFSGEVAAYGYARLDSTRVYRTIFILGPSHRVGFNGAAVYVAGDYLTPLGKVTVDTRTGKELLRADPVFTDRTDAHALEHSVEVQIPFLQRFLRTPFSIVPIVIGGQRPETCARIAAALAPYLAPENLFVISTDFSHYPEYEDAVRADHATAGGVLTGSPEAFLKTVNRVEGEGTPRLETAMCGWSCVLTLLDMTQRKDGIAYELVRYRNSGDVASYGNRQNVVGYCAIVAYQKDTVRFSLGPAERQCLLTIARDRLESCVRGTGEPAIVDASLPGALRVHCGAFVTLNSHGALRGCIGRFDASEPLFEVVQEMTVAAATQDPRFNPVRPEELGSIDMEISVLTPMKRISSIDEFELGRHGIYIRKGGRSGTFLPQVAKETGWTKEEFLGHCARDKAGLSWDGWKDAELYVYEALVFGERDQQR